MKVLPNSICKSSDEAIEATHKYIRKKLNIMLWNLPGKKINQDILN